MQKKIKIYSTEHCPYCIRAKNFFKDKGLVYEDIDLTNQFDEIDAMKEKTGHRTVPMIFVGEEFIGGYTDLIEKIQSKTLDFFTQS